MTDKSNSPQYLPEISIVLRPLSIERKPVRDAEDMINFILNFLDKDEFQIQEKIAVLLLDESNIPIGGKILFSGSKDSVDIDFRVVFQLAIAFGAQQVVVAHNHPGHDVQPSDSDIDSAIRGAAIGRFLGIKYKDDIILCQKIGTDEVDWFSMNEAGILID